MHVNEYLYNQYTIHVFLHPSIEYLQHKTEETFTMPKAKFTFSEYEGCSEINEKTRIFLFPSEKFW